MCADDESDKKIINLNELEDLIECEKELKLNDPLLSSFPLFDTPPSSSHSNSIPSSPSSISSSTSKRSKCSTKLKESAFELNLSSDDEFDLGESQRRRKKNKYYSSDRSSGLNLNLKDPMMSSSHSPPHFTADLNYMDHMFFSSSQYLEPSLSADDSIDLCTILNDNGHDMMIG